MSYKEERKIEKVIQVQQGNVGGSVSADAYGKIHQKWNAAGVEVGAGAHANVYYKDDNAEAQARADAYAKALAEASVKPTGLKGKAEATAGVSAGVEGKVNVLRKPDGPTLGGNAKASTEATAKGEVNVGKKIGYSGEATLGPMAEAGAKFGTKEDNVGIGVSTGGAKIKAKCQTEFNKEEESLQLGFATGVNLGIGAEVSGNTKIHNPINRDLRKDLVSGDVKKTTIAIADVVNPHKLVSNTLGFKPKNTAEEVVARIPVVNVAAAVGRKFKFW